MWRSYFKIKNGYFGLMAVDFFILLLLVTQTYLDVLFNSGTKDFYDILQTPEKRSIRIL